MHQITPSHYATAPSEPQIILEMTAVEVNNVRNIPVRAGQASSKPLGLLRSVSRHETAAGYVSWGMEEIAA